MPISYFYFGVNGPTRLLWAPGRRPGCTPLSWGLFSRQVLSQSPLVAAIGQDGQPMAHEPSFVHWIIQVAHLRDRNKAR